METEKVFNILIVDNDGFSKLGSTFKIHTYLDKITTESISTMGRLNEAYQQALISISKSSMNIGVQQLKLDVINFSLLKLFNWGAKACYN